METQVNDQVVSLSQWKQENTESIEEKNYKKYLNSLNFNDLIAESNDIIRSLKKRPLDKQKVMSSRLIMKEFKSRLGSSSTHTSALNQQNVEQRILDLTKFVDEQEQ